MVILDTSFINSLFEEKDSNHEEAKKIFFNLDEDENIKIPLIVAFELVIHEEYEKLLFASKKITTRFLNNNEDDITFVKTMSYATRKKLKANDCMIIALTVRKKAQLITFDKNLSKTFQNL